MFTGSKNWTETQNTMLLLLLSAAAFSVGVSYDSYDVKDYGSSHRMRVPIQVHHIEFMPKRRSGQTVLWTRDDPETSRDVRWRMSGSHYQINRLTQRDSGRYVLSDRSQNTLFTKTIEVVAKRGSRTLTSGEHLSITSDLEPNSCNIYFVQQRGYRKSAIVLQGTLQQPLDGFACPGFEFSSPCGILNRAVAMSCSGQFEVRDHNDNLALEVSLEVESPTPEFNTSYLFYGGCAFAFLFLSCCLKFCCVTKSSRGKKPSKLGASCEETAGLPEFDHEPVGGRQTPPADTRSPVQPLPAPTSPLIHNLTVDPLPAYSEVSAPAEQPDLQTILLCPDYEPRFELKGMTSDSLSSSDPTHSDVYTSDKLNFL